MLDFADAVAINKFERRGAEDALRDVRRQMARNREAFDVDPEELPVFGTIAARFNDDGVTALYQHLRDRARPSAGLPRRRGHAAAGRPARASTKVAADRAARRGPATWPRSPRRCAATTPTPRRRSPPCARVGNLLGAQDVLAERGRGHRRRRRRARATRSTPCDADEPRAARRLAAPWSTS